MDDIKKKIRNGFNEVRRKTIWGGDSRRRTLSLSQDKSNLDDFVIANEHNIYKKEVMTALKTLFDAFYQEDTITALRNIGYLSWSGGPVAAKCAGEYLSCFTEALANQEELAAFRLEIIKAVSGICYLCKSNQEIASGHYYFRLLHYKPEAELKQQGSNWTEKVKKANNRVRWQGVVDDLCSTGCDGLKSCGLITMLVNILDEDGGQVTQEMKQWSCYALLVILVDNFENQTAALSIPTLKSLLENFARKSWRGWERNEALELYSLLGYEYRK